MRIFCLGRSSEVSLQSGLEGLFTTLTRGNIAHTKSPSVPTEIEDGGEATNQIPQHDAIARQAKMKEMTELGLKHMEDKRVCTTLLGHEIDLQDIVANVAGAVKWGEDYIKDAVKDLPYASIVLAGV